MGREIFHKKLLINRIEYLYVGGVPGGWHYYDAGVPGGYGSTIGGDNPLNNTYYTGLPGGEYDYYRAAGYPCEAII